MLLQETLLDPTAMFSEAARAAGQSPTADHVSDSSDGDDELSATGSSPASGAGEGAGAGAFHPVESRAQRKLAADLEDVTVSMAAAETAEPTGSAPVEADANARAPSPRGPATKRKAPCSPTSPDTVLGLALGMASRRTGVDVPSMQSLDETITEVPVA